MKYKFVRSIEEEDGEPLTINGQIYNYMTSWPALLKEKRKRRIVCAEDVRAAAYILDELGIPNIRTFADNLAEDSDGEPIIWQIYWA